MGTRPTSWTNAAALWLCAFLGGGLTGTGLFLAAQVEVLLYLRSRVEDLGFFERLVGRLTFLWRGPDERIALAMAEIPEAYLEHSAAAARILALVGSVGLAVVLPLLFRVLRSRK